jgi:hypothetical protein
MIRQKGIGSQNESKWGEELGGRSACGEASAPGRIVILGCGCGPESFGDLKLSYVLAGRQHDEHFGCRVAVASEPIDPVSVLVVFFGFPSRGIDIVMMPVEMGFGVIVIGVFGVKMAERGLAEGTQQANRNREMQPLAHDSFSLHPAIRIEY